jgi:hypothetical protein
VDYNFPTGVVLRAQERVLVVSFDPVHDTNSLVSFRGAYPQLGAGVRLYGPYDGKLDNGGEGVEVRRPGVPVGEYVPYIVEERVRYDDAAPWDGNADGTGWSLQRLEALAYGNEPLNWEAGPPTPGGVPGPVDSDNDGMPDSWEIAYGFNPADPSDALLDADYDGLNNVQEFQAGTHPHDPESVLRFERITPAAANSVTLVFVALANRTYTVEYADQIYPPAWKHFQDIEATSTDRVIELPAATDAAKRFYRIRTPKAAPEPPELKIKSVGLLPGTTNLRITFEAAPDQSYSVEHTEELDAGAWSAVCTFPAVSTNRLLECVTPISGSARFYRLRSP